MKWTIFRYPDRDVLCYTEDLCFELKVMAFQTSKNWLATDNEKWPVCDPDNISYAENEFQKTRLPCEEYSILIAQADVFHAV